MKQNNESIRSVVKEMLIFVCPLILIGILQQLYEPIDSFIVGNYIGEKGLAAVGISSTVNEITLMIINAFVIGCTILVSHSYGAKDYDKISIISKTFCTTIFVSSCIITLCGIVFCREILFLLNTPMEVFDYTRQYLSIRLAGIPFIAVYNLSAAILRGMGNSKEPFYVILSSSILNIILDILFVVVFKWGVAGAAIATVIAQLFSGICMYISMYRNLIKLDIDYKQREKNYEVFADGAKLSIPQIIQAFASSGGGFFLQNIINSFGKTAVAALNIAYSIDVMFVLLPIGNVTSAITVFTGQSIGANDFKKSKRVLRYGILICLPYLAIIVTMLLIFGKNIMDFFGLSDQGINIAYRFICLYSAFYFIFALQLALSSYLKGHKDVIFPSIAMLCGIWFRVGFSYIFKNKFGMDVIPIAEIISWVLVTIACYLRYKFISENII